MSKIKSPFAKAEFTPQSFNDVVEDKLAEAVSAESTDNFESKPSALRQLADMEDKYLRALADYQNLAKQHLKDKQDFARYANENLLQDFIPVYDYLKMSLAHAEAGNKWLEGIKHVLNQFKKVLEDNGVVEIVTQGAVFDYATMEAVGSEDTDEADKDGLVAKEMKSGYSLNGKVIVPARVTVYRHATRNKNSTSNENL